MIEFENRSGKHIANSSPLKETVNAGRLTR
nr:MAG TPA: hypothetical protein [Caudoviricetes sp.]